MFLLVSLIKESQSSLHIDVLLEITRAENIDYEVLKKRVSSDRVIIPKNAGKKRVRFTAISDGLVTKVNVNVSMSGV
jgi:thiamine biosynthesis protein ThiC